MIDFDKLVLNPLEDIFSIRVRFIYATTQPNAPPYETRGIFCITPWTWGCLMTPSWPITRRHWAFAYLIS